MTRASAPRRRADFHEADGVLLVWRDPPAPPSAAATAGQPEAVPGNPAEGAEILVAVWDDGSVSALNGHVDLGTGIRTALGQIAAEELDVQLQCVTMLMGSTAVAPNQGSTIASASIQNHAAPMRIAAAQARAWLVNEAARLWQLPTAALSTDEGHVYASADPTFKVSFAHLVRGRHVELKLDPGTRVKAVGDYRIVGQSAARVDIPGKAEGALTFVHDMRVQGMAHGRVVRPPYAGVDAGPFVGTSLISVDEASIAHVPGILAIVVQGDFVGVVAEREDWAEQAMRELAVQWKPWPGMQGLDDMATAISANPSTRRLLMEKGDVGEAIASAATPMQRRYLWPYQLHASIGPSCALAEWQDDGHVRVWAGTQSPHVLRKDLAQLLGLPDMAVDVVRMEAAGCYGRNCADDVAADAALLARAAGRPVRVQLTREQEHAWEPKGAAQLMQVDGGLDADGGLVAYDFQTSYPSNGAPLLASLLTGAVDASPRAYEMGDRTAVPPYDVPNQRIVSHDMAPILRASWLRGVAALPNSFAHESYIDEAAVAAGVDPVAYRLRYLNDVRASELLRATADKAGWKHHVEPQQQGADGDWLKGQGVAYARYVHSRFPGFGAAWAAWVADVEVNSKSGEVHVSRIVVGHDAGLMINPAGVRHQIHGNVLQTTSRALKEKVPLNEKGAPASLEWGAYPILDFREVPVVEVMMMPRPDQPPLGAGESASVPGTAAIANAIFDATGVRFRQPPFTPEVVKAGLDARQLQGPVGNAPAPAAAAGAAGMASEPQAVEGAALAARRNLPHAPAWWPRRRAWWARAGAVVAGVVGVAGALLGWRPAIAPVAAGVQASLYTQATIEKGRALAAAGDCAVCHTAPGGHVNAGGLAMETPFGTVYSTNITPDPATGIGQWSFSAFQRAMREGISRDGHHLYPAFPYTAFTKVNDEDLTALYAYLMSQPPVVSDMPETKLAFPFSVRPLMAFWNALYLEPGPVEPAAGLAAAAKALPVSASDEQKAEWARGEYLVNGLGHCASCHSPRNAMGAEKAVASTFAGAMVDGWEAPALTSLSLAPRPWTKDELYQYLRFGHTEEHGVATGPMAKVVAELTLVPESDVRAMATYLVSFSDRAGSTPRPAADIVADAAARSAHVNTPAQRMFETACGACHHEAQAPQVLGTNSPLALNTNLHSDRPDNLLRVIMEGVQEPATRDLGFMPSFKHALSDSQVAELAAYMRSRYAPDRPAWTGLEAAAASVRATTP